MLAADYDSRLSETREWIPVGWLLSAFVVSYRCNVNTNQLTLKFLHIGIYFTFYSSWTFEPPYAARKVGMSEFRAIAVDFTFCDIILGLKCSFGNN